MKTKDIVAGGFYRDETYKNLIRYAIWIGKPVWSPDVWVRYTNYGPTGLSNHSEHYKQLVNFAACSKERVMPRRNNARKIRKTKTLS